MGLSVIAEAPNWEQQMRVSNQANSFQFMSPGQWTGEQNLNGLGLADYDPTQNNYSNATNVINAVGSNAVALAEALKKNKKNKGKPTVSPMGHPVIDTSAHGGGGGLPSWVIWGGVALAGGLILYTVLKKKKKGGRDHDDFDHKVEA